MSESDDLRPRGTGTLAGDDASFVGVMLVGELGTGPSSGKGKLQGDGMVLGLSKRRTSSVAAMACKTSASLMLDNEVSQEFTVEDGASKLSVPCENLTVPVCLILGSDLL